LTEENYFLNEDFTLIDRQETISMNESSPVTIWTWVIERNLSKGDSVEIAKITNIADVDNEGCGCGDARIFAITNELWYNKRVGDNLHFDYIRKSRFFKIVNDERVNDFIRKDETQVVETPTEPAVTQANDLETERRVMELERQKIQLELELEKLKMK
jgi:hypothetical protein